jgi:hypothetical protein
MRGAEDAHHQQPFAQPGPVFDRLRGQRQHGDQAALAVVVGTQDQHHVLERDDDGQRPEEDGQDAVDVGGSEGDMAGAEDLFDRIQNTGADVAVDNTDGVQSQNHPLGPACGGRGSVTKDWLLCACACLKWAQIRGLRRLCDKMLHCSNLAQAGMFHSTNQH